jgi:hypothetical protein
LIATNRPKDEHAGEPGAPNGDETCRRTPEGAYIGDMTAQPEYSLGRDWPAPTIKGVREALPEADRAAFTAELDDASLDQVRSVLEIWRARAVLYANGTDEKMAAARAGTLRVVPAEDVVRGWPRR